MKKQEIQKMAYVQMLRIRRFEEQIHQYFLQGKLHGTTHLYIGQEAVAVGVCQALKPGDLFTSTHRGHGHEIAMGGKLAPMFAELLGKQTGYCCGRGGSMHIGHISHGNLGANGIVGGGHAIAVGAALAQKMQGKSEITVCFFGDGSTNEGSFHESMNLASLWNLPVLFVCENNQYGLSTPLKKSMKIPDIALRAAIYGMEAATVDGNSFDEVFTLAQTARKKVQTKGPFLLVCNTYRIMGHSKSDHEGYRSRDEVDSWREKDPIQRLGQTLISGRVAEQELLDLQKQVEEELAQAVLFAEESNFPDIDQIYQNVYTNNV